MDEERKLEKIIFKPEGADPVEFFVLEQTRLGGRDYILVTDFEEAKEALQQQTNTIKVSENPAGYTVGIYKGNVVSGLTELDKEQFQWENSEDYQGIPDREISLDSIFHQAIEAGWSTVLEMLTVFFSMPLKGYVFACGNYKLENWNLEGTMKGFA